MSQDLFAAFNASTDDSQPTHDSRTTHPINHDDDDDDEDEDDFGDFEDASVPAAASSTSAPQHHEQVNPAAPSLPFEPKTDPTDGPEIGSHPFAGRMDLLFDADEDEYDAGADDLHDLSRNPEAAMEFSKRMIAEQNRVGGQLSPHPERPPGSTRAISQRSRDPNVLFDAEDLSEDTDPDDWGDFEGTSSSTAQANPLSSSLDLLGLESEAPSATAACVVPRAGRSARQASEQAGIPMAVGPDDPWDNFDECLPDATAPGAHHSTSAHVPQTASADLQSRKTAREDEYQPPTNIPPPAILLSLFPPLMASAQDVLFDPLSKLGAQERRTLLAHPATHQFLKGHIDLAVVLGHVIAGRKLRWKRDQILARSTRIGPAAAGGKGGMKLAGLDRSEATKEDREVLDVVRLWKAQAGRLRSAVTAASPLPPMPGAKLPPIPDISEQIPVRVLKPLQGGLVAPHACALCGLRREERVTKVDVQVDDSFGEWWLETANMHMTCKTFWEEHKSKLKSR